MQQRRGVPFHVTFRVIRKIFVSIHFLTHDLQKGKLHEVMPLRQVFV